MLAWPWGFFPPVTEGWRLAGVAASGGVTVANISRLTRTDGGGLWTCSADGIELVTAQQIKTARALDFMLDGGAALIEVPAFEYPFQPRPIDAVTQAPVPHSDGSSFDDGSLYGAGRTMTVVLAVDAPLRATTLRILPIALGPLEGGEKFTIVHPIRGARKYGIGRVTPIAGDPAGAIDITIRPPLREAAPARTDLDFDRPRCVMRLANPDVWLSPLDALHEMTAAPVWVEAF